MVTFTKREILEQLVNSENDIESAIQYILEKLQHDPNSICPDAVNHLRISLRTLKSKYKIKYEKANRKQDRFLVQNENWLNTEFNIQTNKLFEKSNVKAAGPGRPKMEFNVKRDRSKRQEIASISAEHNHDPQKLLMACRYAARHSKQIDLDTILARISEIPEQPKKIRKLLDTPQVEIKKKSAEEALAFLFDGSMSKDLYIKMRLASKNAGADIWPSYNDIRKAKSECRPPKESISITETIAEVEL